MSGITWALRRVHEGENHAHALLLRLGDVHADEPEIRHVSIDLAAWSAENVRRIADAAGALGLDLAAESAAPSWVGQRLRAAAAALAPQELAGGLDLLNDLRDIYLHASDVSLRWEMLAQISLAQRDTDILDLTEDCHPQNLRQIRWANTMLKTLTPQVLSGL